MKPQGPGCLIPRGRAWEKQGTTAAPGDGVTVSEMPIASHGSRSTVRSPRAREQQRPEHQDKAKP